MIFLVLNKTNYFCLTYVAVEDSGPVWFKSPSKSIFGIRLYELPVSAGSKLPSGYKKFNALKLSCPGLFAKKVFIRIFMLSSQEIICSIDVMLTNALVRSLVCNFDKDGTLETALVVDNVVWQNENFKFVSFKKKCNLTTQSLIHACQIRIIISKLWDIDNADKRVIIIAE